MSTPTDYDSIDYDSIASSNDNVVESAEALRPSSPNRRVALLGSGAALLAAACAPQGSTTSPAAPSAVPPVPAPALPEKQPAPPPPMTPPPPSSPAPGGGWPWVAPLRPPVVAPVNAPAPPAPTAVSVELAIDKLTFGPRPGLRAEIEARGVAGWIDDQLAPVSANVADAEARTDGYITLRHTHRQNYEMYKVSGGEERMFLELDHATLQRAVYSKRQLQELMCDFWFNHFNVWRRKNWMTFLLGRWNETVIRPYALGRFDQLLWMTAHETAMLNYLDNTVSNVNKGVNENYARELMELHTLGVNNGAPVYTEADVRGVAKLLTGWGINWDDNEHRYSWRFNAWDHDRSALTLLGGAFTRPARNYGDWSADGDRFLALLARHPSTARHLATKLCKRFVSDTPSAGLIDQVAAAYQAHDTAIAPTLRTLFASAEFAGSANAKVRRPFEHLVALLRATNATMPTAAVSNSAKRLSAAHDGLGQPLFERVSPDGYPDADRFWMSSQSILRRWQASAVLCSNSVTSQSNAGDRVRVDLASLLPNPLPPTVGALIAWIASSLANYDIGAADISSLCTQAGIGESQAATVVTSSPERLAFVFALVFAHPTFQRR